MGMSSKMISLSHIYGALFPTTSMLVFSRTLYIMTAFIIHFIISYTILGAKLFRLPSDMTPMNYDNDICNVQPVDHLELREDMSWTMVTPTVIRIDGPSEPFLLNYRQHNSDFDDVDIIYKYFVSVWKKL